MQKKVESFRRGERWFNSLYDSYNGWSGYARWANSFNLREGIKKEIIEVIWDKI